MLVTISDRVSAIKPSATLEIDSLAKSMIAQGEDVISFAAGEPDFNPPQIALDYGQVAISGSSVHKYSNVAGLESLRAKIVTDYNAENGHDLFTADNVVITNGGKEAVFLALATIINPGDEVLLPVPSWLTYDEVIRFFGGVVVSVNTAKSNDYKVTVADLEAVRTPKAKVLMLNSPSNPTGAIYSEFELREIALWALENGVIIISDEIYDHLIYGEVYERRFSVDSPFAPHILEVCPEAKSQVIVINGVAKSFAMTGWRLGWVIADDAIIGGVKRLKGHLSSNTNNLAQMLALKALESASVDRENMRKSFEERNEIILSLLAKVELPDGSKLDVLHSTGAFYAFCDISQFLGKPLGISKSVANTATELAKLILEETKVAVVPMESFGIDNHIRLSYALNDAKITEGITRLIDFFGAS